MPRLRPTPVAGFAITVVAVFAALVCLNLSGTSVATLTPDYLSDPSTVLGTPRTIRGDEATIETPLAISAARQGFPRHQYVGLTLTDQQAVAHGAPSRSVFEVFRPQNWGYLLLSPSLGLAMHWWMPFLVCLLGLIALLRALSVDRTTSILLAIIGTFTPYAAWWSAPSPALVVGYGTLVGAAVLISLGASSTRVALLAAVGAGFAATAFFLTLYPPWQISVALIVAGTVLGEVIARRPSRRAFLVTVGGMLAVVVPSLVAWSWSGRDAIGATMSTFYPGQRISAAGEAKLSWLVDAPLNPLLARGRGDSVGTIATAEGFTNLSEVSSSWFPIPLLVAIMIVAARRRWTASSVSEFEQRNASESGCRRYTARPTAWSSALTGVTAAMLVLAAWATLPLPSWTGVFLLERVPSFRVSIGLGLGAVLMIGLVARDWEGISRRDRAFEAPVWIVATGLSALMTVWSAAVLPWDADGVLGRSLLLGAIVAVGFAAISTGVGRRTGGIALAVFAIVSWALVNPLVTGLGPLDSHPLTNRMQRIAEEEPGVLVEVFGDLQTNSLVRAAGVQTLSGVTFYPDEELMQRLAPGQRELWNNYVQYEWKAVDGEPGATIRRISGSHKELQIDPCSASTLELGAKWAVSTSALTMPCLELVDQIQADRTTWLYRIDRT